MLRIHRIDRPRISPDRSRANLPVRPVRIDEKRSERASAWQRRSSRSTSGTGLRTPEWNRQPSPQAIPLSRRRRAHRFRTEAWRQATPIRPTNGGGIGAWSTTRPSRRAV